MLRREPADGVRSIDADDPGPNLAHNDDRIGAYSLSIAGDFAAAITISRQTQRAIQQTVQTEKWANKS